MSRPSSSSRRRFCPPIRLSTSAPTLGTWTAESEIDGWSLLCGNASQVQLHRIVTSQAHNTPGDLARGSAWSDSLLKSCSAALTRAKRLVRASPVARSVPLTTTCWIQTSFRGVEFAISLRSSVSNVHFLLSHSSLSFFKKSSDEGSGYPLQPA